MIHTDHKLALESWCVPFLYTHSFGHFIVVRPRKGASLSSSSSQTVLNGSSASLKSTTVNHSQLSEIEKRARALELSRILVLLNPDLALAWNYRRESFQTGSLGLKDELHLITLCATRKPKSAEGFYYRRYGMCHHIHILEFPSVRLFFRALLFTGKSYEAVIWLKIFVFFPSRL